MRFRFLFFIFGSLFPLSLCDISISPPNARPLEGRTFECCALKEFPVIFPNPSRLPYKLDGIGINYLLLLEQRLGFRCRYMRLVTNFSDVGFTGFIKALHNCSTGARTPASDPLCSCEVGVGGWMQTPQRNGLVTFIPEFMQGEVLVTAHVDDIDRVSNGAFFVQAFDGCVWAVIALLFVFFAVLKVLERHFRPVESNKKKEGKKPVAAAAAAAAGITSITGDGFGGGYSAGFESPEDYDELDKGKRSTSISISTDSSNSSGVSTWESFWVRVAALFSRGTVQSMFRAAVGAFLEMLGLGEHPGANRHPRRTVLSLVVMVTGVILFVIYEAAMVAVLLDGSASAAYRTPEDLRNCNVAPERVCVPQGGALESFWRSAIATAPCHANRSAQFVPSYARAVRRLVRRNCSFLVGGLSARDVTTGKDCHRVAVVGQPLHWGGISFVFPKHSPGNVTEAFGLATLELRQQGLLEPARAFFEKRGKCRRSEGQSRVGLGQMSVFFITAFVVCIVLLIVILVTPCLSLHNEK